MYFKIDGTIDGYTAFYFENGLQYEYDTFPDIDKLVEWVEEQVRKLRWCCPDCSGEYQEYPVLLDYDPKSESWQCPMCGCSTSYPEEDLCFSLDM